MKAKYCLPIIKNTKKEVIKSLQMKDYDFYEVWTDYVKDLDEKFILEIAKKYKKKIIFVSRRQNLETIKQPLDKRYKFISLLSKINVLLDLDFLTQHEDLEFLRKENRKIKLILSYHNYKETPKLDYLGNLITKMRRYSPEIVKISSFCQREEDGLNLLNLLLKLKAQQLNCVVLGMGKKGLITRIFGSLWGNEIIFAPKDVKEKSAQGQITKKQMEIVLKEMN